MIDPIKTAYIAGYMTGCTWEDGDEREYLERLAEELYESDVKDNWYRLGEAVDELTKLREEKQKFIDTVRSIPKRPKYYPEVLLDIDLGDED